MLSPKGLVKSHRRLESVAEGRKRRKTRERIVAAAMSLFFAKGYEDVKIGDIAAAANVTRRTFFNYFTTKEEVVPFWQDRFGEMIAAAVAVQPAGEHLVLVVEEALTSTIATVSARDVAIDRLVSRTPALISREYVKYGGLEDTLASALARRVRGEGAKLQAHLLAVIVVGTLRLASADCRRRCDLPSSAVFSYSSSQVFQALWVALRDIGISGLTNRPTQGQRSPSKV